MTNRTITITLDPQTALAYERALPEENLKIQALLSLWLRELVGGEHHSLQQILNDVWQKAKARGLTPEMLDSILNGA